LTVNRPQGQKVKEEVMEKEKIKVKVKELSKFDSFLEGLVNDRIDFSLEDNGNSIRMYLPGTDVMNFSIVLHRNGTYSLE
jgi:ASC-1-like (ASCH) protein